MGAWDRVGEAEEAGSYLIQTFRLHSERKWGPKGFPRVYSEQLERWECPDLSSGVGQGQE